MRGRPTFDASTDRWSRSDWWGVVLEAPDGIALAHFYADLLGWRIEKEEDGEASIAPENGVGYLDEAVAHAVELGAVPADFQPQENVRVMLDPAGHPFCLYS